MKEMDELDSKQSMREKLINVLGESKKQKWLFFSLSLSQLERDAKLKKRERKKNPFGIGRIYLSRLSATRCVR